MYGVKPDLSFGILFWSTDCLFSCFNWRYGCALWPSQKRQLPNLKPFINRFGLRNYCKVTRNLERTNYLSMFNHGRSWITHQTFIGAALGVLECIDQEKWNNNPYVVIAGHHLSTAFSKPESVRTNWIRFPSIIQITLGRVAHNRSINLSAPNRTKHQGVFSEKTASTF